VKNKLL